MTEQPFPSDLPQEPGLTRLEALEVSLPAPMGTRLREAITSMIAFYLFNWDHPELESRAQSEESHRLADQFADGNLERMGPARLASREFWDCYQAAREAGQPAHWALDAAAEKTPHLSVRAESKGKRIPKS